MQAEESTGTCTDSHDPLSHVWPRPPVARATPPTPANTSGPSATVTNTSLRIVVQQGCGGGPRLAAAVARCLHDIFAPVAGKPIETVDPLARGASPGAAARAVHPGGDDVTITVEVRDPETETAAPVTDQDESYTLDLGAQGSGMLRANTTVGAIRGLATLAQLFEYTAEGSIELHWLPLLVADRPRWPYRGLKVDTSRHFIGLEQLRDIVRAMEATKLNVLQWHIIDGQSFPLESALFPELAANGRYCPTCVYTQDDVRELVAFAADRAVRVIPELDIPGHSGFQYGKPEIVACPYDESGGGSNRALDPTLDETYSFLTEFLSEQATLFGDPVINVYGDEVRFACWNSSASVMRWMREHNVPDFQGLTQLFWKRFAAEVAPAVRNRTGVAVMIGEADVWGTDGPPFELPQWLAQADPGYPLPLLVEVWGGHTLERSVNGTLRKVLSTPGMRAVIGGAYYLDQDLPRPFGGGGDSPLVWHAPYWVSVWRTMYAIDPVGDPELTEEQKRNVVGVVAEMWGEQINSGVVEQRIFPHALAVSERGWTDAAHFPPGGSSNNSFFAEAEGRLNQMSCTLNRRGVRSSPSAPGHCLWSLVP